MNSRLLIDVCFAHWMADLLKARGYACVYMAEIELQAPDHAIARHGAALRAVVMTHDWDFGELVVRQRLRTHGVVIVDIASFQDADAPERLNRLLSDHEDGFEGRLTIIRRRRVRQRPAPGYPRPMA